MRTNFIISIATLVLGVAKTFAEPDPNFHIYLAFGQSNMLSGDIESQDKNVDSRFQMISTVNDCGSRRLGEWYTAVPPLASCNAGLGPVPYFGNTLVEKLPKEIKVGVAVVGIAGCDIQLFEKDRYQSYEHADWMTYYIDEYGGNPYGRLVDMGKIAQKSGVIKGILVHQGETNNGNQDWPKRLKGVYENLLTDLGLKAENVPLIVGELVQSDKGGICGGMNNIIQTVPEVIPTAHIVSSEGLEQQGDGFHFTSASHRILGKRYAEVMLSILDGTTPIKQGGGEPDKDGYYFHNTFENGAERWENRGYASVAQSKDTAYKGNGSLYCEKREYNWSGASRSLSSNVFEPGKEFSFSAVVKYDEGPESQTFFLSLQYNDDSGETQYDKIAIVKVTQGEWVQLANTNYKIPANSSNLMFYIETEEELSSFYVDEAIAAPAGTKIEGPNSGASSSSSDNTQCFAIKLGYSCCQQTTKVVYEDSDGEWGVENGEWCGIPSTTSSSSCWSSALGYPCCTVSTDVYYKDNSGSWGVENGDWCGIPN
ncbi:hypothetical protein BCR36DRAFT_580050 [Piromyces finnis]|uniref:CBM10 domain-containing protein n=1 Tax=Piromyces finnis TaxID=1754191 RepID=A0A1Y1VK22_9FUNG|nr:hypothetical protein BCR36DRAFT_580050 [Piromyces finnis]|eukprot:ORX58433.1 hypothetical protein BCR36DRAFT_580050 [Piromyces finnis]